MALYEHIILEQILTPPIPARHLLNGFTEMSMEEMSMV